MINKNPSEFNTGAIAPLIVVTVPVTTTLLHVLIKSFTVEELNSDLFFKEMEFITEMLFVDSDPGQGFWIGCVQDALMNYMIPGIAASEYTQDQVRDNDDTEWKSVQSTQSKYGTTFLPVGEVNRKIFQTGKATPNPDVEANKKPIHPIAERLIVQGTISDPTRGVYTSSARRESPSNVYGWSTPGPIDKRNNAKKGMVGRARNKINKFVSRLGGHCIVMDDGDANWLRKQGAGDGPPDYASVEAGDTSGDVTMPANELIRLRTRTGHQAHRQDSEVCAQRIAVLAHADTKKAAQMASETMFDR